MLESTQDDNTNLRVSLILKNARNDIYFDDDFEEVCNEVLSMALIRNDDDLILMVFTEYPKCAFSAANREAFSLLEKKHPQEWTDIILDGLKADKDNTFIANYPEAMAFLIKQNSKDLSDRIVNSLGGQPNYPSVGVIKRVEYGNNEDNHKLENGQRVKDFRDDYIMAIANYNKMCRVLLNLSITAKNQYLAKRAVSLTMKNAVMSKMDNTYYEISLLETDRQNNKKIYNDAVADGVFK